ncbi:MAG TPA: sterol desaturase family protein [Xanthobacteraceae bacterium]|nr:sterol desaturase family protein [Xanthobacteraceae bacterium]
MHGNIGSKHDHTYETSSWRYWFDFCLFPAVFCLTVAVYDRSFGFNLGMLFGFVFGTFAEYWAHRTLLHVFFWHGTHERHHQHPKEYVVFPLWRLPAFFATVFLVSHAIGAEGFFAGFTLWYCWFLLLHHMLHHLDLNEHTWLHRYAIWHNRHHKLTHYNYGITTPFWDRMFGTYL